MSLPCSVTKEMQDEISNYMMNMEKFRQDDLDAFDASIMEASATMGSDCSEHRKLRADARADRHNKTASFKKAVSHLQVNYQLCQDELAQVKKELQLAKLVVQVAVPATSNV